LDIWYQNYQFLLVLFCDLIVIGSILNYSLFSQIDAAALGDPDAKKLAVVLRNTYLPEKTEDGHKGNRFLSFFGTFKSLVGP